MTRRSPLKRIEEPVSPSSRSPKLPIPSVFIPVIQDCELPEIKRNDFSLSHSFEEVSAGSDHRQSLSSSLNHRVSVDRDDMPAARNSSHFYSARPSSISVHAVRSDNLNGAKRNPTPNSQFSFTVTTVSDDDVSGTDSEDSSLISSINRDDHDARIKTKHSNFVAIPVKVLNSTRLAIISTPSNEHLFDDLIACICRSLTDVVTSFLAGSRQFQRFVQLKHYARAPVQLEDFDPFRVLGRGAFGAVSDLLLIERSHPFHSHERRALRLFCVHSSVATKLESAPWRSPVFFFQKINTKSVECVMCVILWRVCTCGVCVCVCMVCQWYGSDEWGCPTLCS